MTSAEAIRVRGWQVPEFEEFVFADRHHDYALVIPVINEGERIRRQIEALERLASAVDVIVADGGSTDGSVAPDFLSAHGVRALLVKRGAGRLGAQLRMAYAWCLIEGYDGMVTVDGNGKDGLDAIPRFLDRLREGYDYVQGSRYLPGGVSVNTPLDRRLAGRLVHAPLVSFAARQRFTDSTNGFRAYSSRYLADERVAPFRDAFDQYALLFYLSARGPRLGFRAVEIPVERRYPPNAPAPTKIAGLGGRLRMLAELIGVVRGRYDPPRGRA